MSVIKNRPRGMGEHENPSHNPRPSGYDSSQDSHADQPSSHSHTHHTHDSGHTHHDHHEPDHHPHGQHNHDDHGHDHGHGHASKGISLAQAGKLMYWIAWFSSLVLGWLVLTGSTDTTLVTDSSLFSIALGLHALTSRGRNRVGVVNTFLFVLLGLLTLVSIGLSWWLLFGSENLTDMNAVVTLGVTNFVLGICVLFKDFPKGNRSRIPQTAAGDMAGNLTMLALVILITASIGEYNGYRNHTISLILLGSITGTQLLTLMTLLIKNPSTIVIVSLAEIMILVGYYNAYVMTGGRNGEKIAVIFTAMQAVLSLIIVFVRR